VIGPGLGRSEETFKAVDLVLDKINKERMLIGDADFLWFLSNSGGREQLVEKV
jgi:NAD(P)H-hydrate repair Nnr-like enzyme with NAD(P)H-hydrate dehydratase domain